MNKLLKKYYSLRQEYWTHVLLPFTYIYFGTYITMLSYAVLQNANGNSNDIAGIIISFVTLIYTYIYSIVFILAILNLIFKKKIKNKFLLENKIYKIIWNIGNILAMIFTLFIIFGILYFIFTLLYFKTYYT